MSRIAFRLAAATIGVVAFAAVPALAAHKAKKESAQTPQYQSVTRWDHGKKYTDFVGAPPAAPTQQETAAKREAAAQRNHLQAVTRMEYGKPVYTYNGTITSAPSQQELAKRRQDAANSKHLHQVTRMDHGKLVYDYQ